MAKSNLQLALDARAVLAEGPLWDSKDQRLWWVDIEQGEVHCFDPTTGVDELKRVGQRVGTVVRRAAGGLMLGVEAGIAEFDFETGRLQVLASPETDQPDHRFNDGKCDPSGRFWAGTLNYQNEDLPEGSLYCFDANHQLTRHLTGIRVSNGIVWSADRRSMYYIDSPTRCIDAFDYDDATGTIGNRRTLLHLPDGMGYPDGMTIDAQDHLWVALWAGWGVIRVDSRAGEILERMDVPAAQVTACALGGPDLRDLYITSARRGISASDLERQPTAGGLFHIRVDVPGVPTPRFAG